MTFGCLLQYHLQGRLGFGSDLAYLFAELSCRCYGFAASHLTEAHCQLAVLSLRPHKCGKYEQARMWLSAYGRHHGEILQLKQLCMCFASVLLGIYWEREGT